MARVPGGGGDFGNQEDRPSWCVPGREPPRLEALMQSLHSLLGRLGDTRYTNPASIPPIWGLGGCGDPAD